MRRRVIIFIAVVSALVAVVAACYWQANRQSLQLRKQIEDWLFGSTSWKAWYTPWYTPEMTIFEAQAKAAEALRQFGPALTRQLVDEAMHEPGRLTSRIERFRQNGPNWLRRSPRNRPPLTGFRQYIAASALTLLGKDAQVPLSDLLRMADSAERTVKAAALELLGAQGVNDPASIAVLEKYSRNSVASVATRDFGIQALAAISLYRLQPTNTWALEVANKTLARREEVIVLAPAIFALARMGPAAKPFTPGLNGAANKASFPTTRNTAEWVGQHLAAVALWKIEGTPDASLAYLSAAQAALSGASDYERKSIESYVCELARDMSDCYEFCRAVHPVMEGMILTVTLGYSSQYSNAIWRINRTLAKSTNATYEAKP